MKCLKLLGSLLVVLLLANVTVYAQTGGPSVEITQQIITDHITHGPQARVSDVSNLVIRNSVVESADSVVVLYTYNAGEQYRIGVGRLIQRDSSWHFYGSSSGPIHEDDDLVVLLPQHLANGKLYVAGYTKVSRISDVVLNFKDHSTCSVPVNDGYFCSSVSKKERSDVVSVTAYDKEHRVVPLNKVGNNMGWQ